jgi:hypothetical protein
MKSGFEKSTNKTVAKYGKVAHPSSGVGDGVLIATP